MFYRSALRPLLFSLDAEYAHERTLEMLAAFARLPFASSDRAFTHACLKTSVAGIEFANPIGLAAGCDKNAKAIRMWPRFGFGFVEAGTITAQPQIGNPRPRVFRVPKYHALINRLGFNSEGATVVSARLAELRRGGPLPIPVGINIGKTKLVSGDDATLDDYRSSFRRLAPWSDFMVVNVSSPNTPGLRQWQEKAKLRSLLSMLMAEAGDAAEPAPAQTDAAAKIAVSTISTGSRADGLSMGTQLPAQACRGVTGHSRPLFVKISPDMSESELDDIVDVALEVGISGIVATNTTIGRDGVDGDACESGGLSGRPLRSRARSGAARRKTASDRHGSSSRSSPGAKPGRPPAAARAWCWCCRCRSRWRWRRWLARFPVQNRAVPSEQRDRNYTPE